MAASLWHSVTLALLLLGHSLFCVSSQHNIDDFGAIRNTASPLSAEQNGLAIHRAIQAAAAGANGSRTAIVPRGGDYYFVPFSSFDNISDIVFQLDGTLLAYTEGLDDAWPGCRDGRHGCQTAIQFNNCNNVTVHGPGLIDGRGYDWWRHVIVNHTDHRPDLFGMQLCTNVAISDITLINSPKFHMFINVRIALFRSHICSY
jgi:polygalacturonase